MIITAPQHLCVILFTGGGSLCQGDPLDRDPPERDPWTETPLDRDPLDRPPGQRPPGQRPPGQRPPRQRPPHRDSSQQRLPPYGNERAVRTQLECILVSSNESRSTSCNKNLSSISRVIKCASSLLRRTNTCKR